MPVQDQNWWAGEFLALAALFAGTPSGRRTHARGTGGASLKKRRSLADIQIRMNTKTFSAGRKTNIGRGAPRELKHKAPICGAQEERSRQSASAPTETGRQTAISALHYVFEDAMDSMARGDIILLDDAVSLRELIDPAFFAVLCCPKCGKLDLLTQPQCAGTESVICGYDDCACHFRISGRRAIDYLPVN